MCLFSFGGVAAPLTFPGVILRPHSKPWQEGRAADEGHMP